MARKRVLRLRGKDLINNIQAIIPGPASARVAPDPIKRPVPIVPPIAIILICLAVKCRRSTGKACSCGLLLLSVLLWLGCCTVIVVASYPKPPLSLSLSLVESLLDINNVVSVSEESAVMLLDLMILFLAKRFSLVSTHRAIKGNGARLLGRQHLI